MPNDKPQAKHWQEIDSVPRDRDIELSFDGRSYFIGRHQLTELYPLNIMCYDKQTGRRWLRPKLWRELARAEDKEKQND